MLDKIEIMLDPFVDDPDYPDRDRGVPITPVRSHPTDAGLDLYAPYFQRILAHHDASIETGVHARIPEGHVGLIVGRSGMNVNHGIICPVGTVDAGYTGTLVVKLYNMTDVPYDVHTGDRIAQLLILPIETPAPVQVYDLPETDRGGNGFGSTGK